MSCVASKVGSYNYCDYANTAYAMSVTCIASNIGSYRYCEYAMMDMLTQLAYCDVGLVLRAALGVIGIVNTQTWQA